MIAVDTNLIVRYLTRDDPEQSTRAMAVFGGDEAVFVSTTVLLEVEWVLRAAYGFDRERVADALRAFAGLPNLAVEAPGALVTALGWAAHGMDFADALHLAQAEGCEVFLTFDQRLATLAERLATTAVRAP